MKTRTTQTILSFLALVIMLTTTGYIRPSEAANERIQTRIEVSFVNVHSQSLHQPDTVYVTLNDPQGRLIDISGQPAQHLIGADGRVELALPASATASPAAPYRFWIKVEADGFLYNMQAVEVNASGTLCVEVDMIDWRELPMGN